MNKKPNPSITLKDGVKVEIIPDKYSNNSYELIIDGTPQSHVDMNDSEHLFFEYVRRIGHAIDEIKPTQQPISALHLGAGALTLARYIHETRPGSIQNIIELEPKIIELVRQELPLPKNMKPRIRYGDARAVAEKLPSGMKNNMDIIIVDIFSGSRTPAHVTSIEFYEILKPLLSSNGIILLNIADAPGLQFAKNQGATLQYLFKNVCAIAEAQVIKGRRFGNIVFLAGENNLPLEMLPRLLAAGPHPAQCLSGKNFKEFIKDASIIFDHNAKNSPLPEKTIFSSIK